jgi:hypothetical protein
VQVGGFAVVTHHRATIPTAARHLSFGWVDQTVCKQLVAV